MKKMTKYKKNKTKNRKREKNLKVAQKMMEQNDINGAYSFFVKAVDITPQIACQVIQVIYHLLFACLKFFFPFVCFLFFYCGNAKKQNKNKKLARFTEKNHKKKEKKIQTRVNTPAKKKNSQNKFNEQMQKKKKKYHLSKCNILYVVAPYEADAQLAYLNKHNKIDIVLTEDSDLLAYSC